MSETETEIEIGSGQAGPSEGAKTGDPEQLGQVFASLSVQAETGVLTITQKDVERKILVFEGVCCSFQSNSKADALGAVLSRSGWLNEERMQEIRARTRRAMLTSSEVQVTDLPVGQDLRSALRLQLQEVAASSFAWESMSFHFDADSAENPTSAGLNIDPLGIVADGFLRFVPAATIDQILASFGVVPVGVNANLPSFIEVLHDVYGRELIGLIAKTPRPLKSTLALAADPRLAARALATLASFECLVHVEPEETNSPVEVPETGTPAAPPPAPEEPASQPARSLRDEVTALLDLPYYELLGVSRDAPADAVRDAIGALKGKYDPQKSPQVEGAVKDLLVKITSRLAQAQATLLHPDARKAYDASLVQGRRTDPGEGRTLRLKVEPLLAQARTFESAQDWTNARETMIKAIDLLPRDADLHAALGWYTYKCRTMDPRERERLWKHHLEYSVELQPAGHLAYTYLGTIYANQGNQGRARLEFGKALKNNPGFAPAREGMDKLGRRSTLESEPVVPKAFQKKQRRSYRNVQIAAVVVLAGLALFTVNRNLVDPRGTFDLSPEKLGTKLEVTSITTSQGLVVIDAGPVWSSLATKEREREFTTIVASAKKLGYSEVIVFQGSTVVAQSKDGKITALEKGGAAPPPPATRRR